MPFKLPEGLVLSGVDVPAMSRRYGQIASSTVHIARCYA
jgi:hypothetical protein